MTRKLLASIWLLSLAIAQADTDSERAQAETWPSPDGRIVIAQPTFRGPILFIDAATQETLHSQRSTAKTVGVTWSADSSWVAFSEYFNPHSGGSAFHVYSVAGKHVKLIKMPDGPLTDREWWSVDPKRWLPDNQLELEAEQEKWIDESKPGYPVKRWDLYKFIVRCHRNGTSKLVTRRFLSTRSE